MLVNANKQGIGLNGPAINASRSSRLSGVMCVSSSMHAPKVPSPPAWASIIPIDTGVPSGTPIHEAALAVKPLPNGIPKGPTFDPIFGVPFSTLHKY